MCSLRWVFALGFDSQVTSANVSGWSWQRILRGITFGFILFSSTEPPFLPCSVCFAGSYKHKEVSYLLITVFTQERLGAAIVSLEFFAHFVLLCFCNYTNTCLWGGSLYGDSEDHQPATSMDLSKASGWDACSKAYDWDFEVSLHLFSAFRMKNELPITVDMWDTTLHMVETCSACILLGPQLGIHQVWKRGLLARRRRGKEIALWSHPIFLACASCGREVNASHLCFPSRALEQDETIKARCQRIVTVSLLCKLHTQMLLFSALGLADSHS